MPPGDLQPPPSSVCRETLVRVQLLPSMSSGAGDRSLLDSWARGPTPGRWRVDHRQRSKLRPSRPSSPPSLWCHRAQSQKRLQHSQHLQKRRRHLQNRERLQHLQRSTGWQRPRRQRHRLRRSGSNLVIHQGGRAPRRRNFRVHHVRAPRRPRRRNSLGHGGRALRLRCSRRRRVHHQRHAAAQAPQARHVHEQPRAPLHPHEARSRLVLARRMRVIRRL